MVNPIAVAGCLAIGFGGLAFAFVGGDSRADKRRAAVAKSDPKALNASANVDRAARKKQIADGLRDIERKGKESSGSAWRPGSIRRDSRSPPSNIGLAAWFSACFSAPSPTSSRRAR